MAQVVQWKPIEQRTAGRGEARACRSCETKPEMILAVHVLTNEGIPDVSLSILPTRFTKKKQIKNYTSSAVVTMRCQAFALHRLLNAHLHNQSPPNSDDSGPNPGKLPFSRFRPKHEIRKRHNTRQLSSLPTMPHAIARRE